MNTEASAELNEPTKWLFDQLRVGELPGPGEVIELNGTRFMNDDGILSSVASISESQKQTEETFKYKWGRRDTYDSDHTLQASRNWLVERYGDLSNPEWLSAFKDNPVLLDAGCGSGMSSLELFQENLDRVRYVGVDISAAVHVARQRFSERGISGAFLRADISNLPICDESLDIVFSEGVLHHTDSTERALHGLAKKLKPGGTILFYVYRRKGPIREFSDDYIRNEIAGMPPDEAWAELLPLTKLGKALGATDAHIDIPEDIPMLGIKRGRVSVQRFIYWNIFKAFYRDDMTIDEMNHVNFDWYAPKNAHRQSPDEVKTWCADAGLEIEAIKVEEAGITVKAKKFRT